VRIISPTLSTIQSYRQFSAGTAMRDDEAAGRANLGAIDLNSSLPR